MRKSTFRALATLGVVGLPLCGFVLLNELVGYSQDAANSARTQRDFLDIHDFVKKYGMNAGRPPATSQGLEALVEAPKSGPKPRRWERVMKKVPSDPWGTPYRYTLLKTGEPEWRWEIRSAGDDQVFGNKDDRVGEAGDGGMFGSSETETEATTESQRSY